MPDFRQIIADIKNRNFAPVYILMGEEFFYLDKITEALEASVVNEEDKEFDQSVLYGADIAVEMAYEAAGRYPLMSEKRLVILKEAQAMHQAKRQLEKLAAYMANPNPMTVFAIVYKGDKLNATSELLKTAKKNKDIVIFDSPKIKDHKIAEVIKDICFAEKISIEGKALDILISNVGASVSNLYSEIEKLKVVLNGENKKITADMVSEHIGISKEFNNFELTNALARRDYYQSIKIVKHFEINPKANPTVVTTGVIFSYFQKLLLAAFSADKSDKGLMETLQLKNSYGLRDVKIGLQNYNAFQLVKAIHAIREFDTKSKGVGSFQKEYPLLLELVCTLLTL